MPVAVDLDRDGRKDLVLGEWYSSVRFYRNTGPDSSPLFTGYLNLVEPDPDSFKNGNPPRVNFADWDGDTDLDMITCDYYGSVFLRRNVTPTGVEEERHTPCAPRCTPNGTIVRGVLFLPTSGEGRMANGELLDISGRKVMNLTPGPNDVSRLAPGIYFLQSIDGSRLSSSGVQRIIVTR